jgi:hypothetical protein
MINVIPLDDIEEHSASGCRCKPTVYFVSDRCIIIHNSFDGREIIEKLISDMKIKPSTNWEVNYY